MSDETPYEVTLQVFPRDIEQLVVSSMRWNDGEVEPGEPWGAQRGRFENMTGPHDPGYHPAAKWKMIYWVDSGDWAGVMLIRAFLEHQCFLYEIASDTVDGEYVVLTDYETPSWRKAPRGGGGVSGLHAIVVTEVPAPPDEPDVEREFSYEVECPGVTDACRTWWECTICTDALAKDEDDSYRDRLDEDSEAHGVEHRLLGFGWAVRSEECWAQVSDDRPDAIEEVFDRAKRPIEPGRYPVTIEDGDPVTFAFAAADAEVAG